MIRQMIVGFLVLGSMVGAGCRSEEEEQGSAQGLSGLVGRECTVQFRRDALGAAASIPIPPSTSEINGASVEFTGKLTSVRGDWLNLEITTVYRSGDGSPLRTVYRRVHIPVASVLYVESR